MIHTTMIINQIILKIEKIMKKKKEKLMIKTSNSDDNLYFTGDIFVF